MMHGISVHPGLPGSLDKAFIIIIIIIIMTETCEVNRRLLPST